MMIQKEVYVGLDTHRENIHGTALDKDGNVVQAYEFGNNEEELKNFFRNFDPSKTFIALEACNFWRGCYRILKEISFSAELADPVKTSQISKQKKTDWVDSRILADLIRTNYLPKIFIPTEDILALRDLTRMKIRLTRICVKVQNSIKACLSRNGIAYEKDIWNRKGIEWLNSLKNEEVDSFLRIYIETDREEKITKKKIEATAILNEDAVKLKSIPGVGYFSALMIVSEIGDINRFPDVKSLHAYVGLVPGIYQSGTKTRGSKRKNVNYWLKFIIGQCSGRAITVKRNNKIQRTFLRMEKKKGYKVARRVAARKLLTIVWHILKEKIPYHES